MARTSLKYLSRQIEAEKSLKHLGTVSVSLDALSFPYSELRCALIDEYTNEKKLDDGEFYYKIRELQGRFGIKNLYFEMRWWAHMRNFYDYVFEKKESVMRRLIREDVEAIQLSAPGVSAEDADRLRGRIKGGMIFKAFTDQERESIWINLCEATKDCLTPSLFGFFENLNTATAPRDYIICPGRGVLGAFASSRWMSGPNI
ncbi:hypothetical protein BN1723_007442 [Verticillium longisporum]|uniref:Uncharacterized protein n=1 Tax=Verticillium longisporum TaxID=100787 RepID=A0A0G4NLE1_VERLO|nr:hypothetical protein BN1708_010589 [Verticillium longisporum]CRK47265.1 hypothetical protein BN1723_007442 [Verticillium longisporum]